MQAYDLDGTLADVNFEQARFKSMAAIFTDAPVIYQPQQPFVVITGRPHGTDAEKRATAAWLRENQPNFGAIYYVDGSQADQIAGKVRILKRLNITDFTDNNTDVLAAVRKEIPNIRLWQMNQQGKRTSY